MAKHPVKTHTKSDGTVIPGYERISQGRSPKTSARTAGIDSRARAAAAAATANEGEVLRHPSLGTGIVAVKTSHIMSVCESHLEGVFVDHGTGTGDEETLRLLRAAAGDDADRLALVDEYDSTPPAQRKSETDPQNCVDGRAWNLITDEFGKAVIDQDLLEYAGDSERTAWDICCPTDSCDCGMKNWGCIEALLASRNARSAELPDGHPTPSFAVEDHEFVYAGMQSPWGEVSQYGIKQVVPGVTAVQTAGHGGLHFSRAAWAALPPDVKRTFMNRGWAEQDCEEKIAIAVLGIGGENREQYLDSARKIAEDYETYAPCLRHIEAAAAGPRRVKSDGQALRDSLATLPR